MPGPVPTLEKCEKCGRLMVMRWGRYGRFLSCSGFPKCRNMWKISDSMPECPVEGCSGHVMQKVDEDGTEYYGCTRWPECDYRTDEAPARGRGGKKKTTRGKTSRRATTKKPKGRAGREGSER
jgi:ssDNA-binding Zn-finger/Zn-ribbon topoisomerase 1